MRQIKIGKFNETEGRLEVTRTRERGRKGELLFNRYRVSIGDGEKFGYR